MKFCEYKLSNDLKHITIRGKQYGIPEWINKKTLNEEKTMEILLRAIGYTYNIPLTELMDKPNVEIRFDSRDKEIKKRRKNECINQQSSKGKLLPNT